MNTRTRRSLALIAAIALLAANAHAGIPDWMPGKNLLISRSINSWNATNKPNVSVDLQRSGIYMATPPGAMRELAVLALTGKITNNSDDGLDSVVIDYVISSKRTGTEVVRIRLAIVATVFKTATVEFKNPFKDMLYESKKNRPVSLDTVKTAMEQLGSDYQWSYVFVAAIPQSIVSEYGDGAYRALDVDVALVEFKPQAD